MALKWADWKVDLTVVKMVWMRVDQKADKKVEQMVL
jgi:hypothetical protein